MTAVNLAKRCRRQGTRQRLRPLSLRRVQRDKTVMPPATRHPGAKTVRITQHKEIGLHPKIRSPLPDLHQAWARFDTHAIVQEDVDVTREVFTSARAFAATCRAKVFQRCMQ